MGKIHELSPHVADLIAAGEVVERPGSVIKELVENAIDAGATILTVEIRAGGMTYMRVTDNGCGMDRADARRAFLRHATSKLKAERDLECIGTLGFRGEALAAIAAVSHIDLLTRETGADEGTSLTIEAGVIQDEAPAGCPEGTTLVIRDLFFNTPARLKFMKSDKAEGANVTQTLIRCALSHPELSVRYLKDGKEEFHTPGDGSLRSAIYTLLGRDFAADLLEAEGETETVGITGFITAPSGARGNRSSQYFYLNGRYIKSKLIQAALEQAYKNSLFTGRFPGCVLHLSMKYGAVDVNVHPTKTEVKFLKEKDVFDAVYYTCLSALERATGMPAIGLTGKLKAQMEKTAPEERTPNAQPGQAQTIPLITPIREAFHGKTAALDLRDGTAAVGQTVLAPPPTGHRPIGAQETPPPAPQAAPSAPSPAVPPAPAHRIIGEAMATYILVEEGDRLVLIDKHAAHERMLFDRFRSEAYMPMPQLLITPFTMEVGPEDTELLLENAALLEEYGFELDRFGAGSVALRTVPGDIDADGLAPLLAEICEKLRMGHKLDPAGVRDEVLHTVACKAAIKAGRFSDPRELEDLVTAVLTGQVKYCPHGRPVSIELTKGALDKSFKRA